MKQALYSLAKRIAFLGLSAAVPAGRLQVIRRRGALTVLNFHKISDAREDSLDAIPSAVFDGLLDWLKTRFDLVTFADLRAGVSNGKPPLILTFDDGYLDFVDVAVPILRKHRVRANQNVIPSCVDSGQPTMTVVLADFIAQAPSALLREIPLPGLPVGADPEDRARSALQACTAFKRHPLAQQKEIWSELAPKIERLDRFRPTPMMRREHILQLIGEVEFGLHSFEHATMTAESEHYLRDDLSRCRIWWNELTGRDPEIYAFPNGAAEEHHVSIVCEAGYSTVLLVGEHLSRPNHNIHPRLTMFGRTGAEVRVRALGGPWFFLRKGSAMEVGPVR